MIFTNLSKFSPSARQFFLKEEGWKGEIRRL
jgi:hypothetical protein